MLHLSEDAARSLHLAAQGLTEPPSRAATKADVLKAIRRMGALQIDTISVVARSPYLVLWSRLGDYQPSWLEELLAEGKLFEYWAHAACFLPLEDFALYRSDMLRGHPRARAWLEEHREVAELVQARIRQNGATRSTDWERAQGSEPRGGWWSWKPEKSALECLFSTGVVMIARRENFHRIYDLQERVLPDWDEANALPPGEARKTLAEKTVRALGVAKPKWVPDYFKQSRDRVASMLEELAAEGRLTQAMVDEWNEPCYIHPSNLALARKASQGHLRSSVTTLLSPFDPVIWDRTRVAELFGLEYRIEVYTPSQQRRYGYFTLPILHRGKLVGRLDPKAHRKEGIFEIRATHLEPGMEVTDELVRDLGQALRDCAAWHGTPEVILRASDPAELAPALQAVVG